MAVRPGHANGTAQDTASERATYVDRPRPGANQTGAGSPLATQQAAQEGSSMTEGMYASVPGEWVPRVGFLERLPADRANLIRGLFELAAWVADHPGTPVPSVVASIDTGLSRWEWQCRVVDQVADALGVMAAPFRTSTGTRYAVETSFGPVGLRACAISEQERASLAAAHSYIGAVCPVASACQSATVGDLR